MAGDNYLVDYPTDEESVVAPGDMSHITGQKNTGSLTRSLSVNTYQWLIVIGSLALLWALRFGFLSTLSR